jgi:hypothetical protein
MRFKEHIQDTKSSKHTSTIARHILNIGHAYSCTEDTMNTLEEFRIYEMSKKGANLNDMFTDMTNPIFETLIQAERRKQV